MQRAREVPEDEEEIVNVNSDDEDLHQPVPNDRKSREGTAELQICDRLFNLSLDEKRELRNLPAATELTVKQGNTIIK